MNNYPGDIIVKGKDECSVGFMSQAFPIDKQQNIEKDNVKVYELGEYKTDNDIINISNTLEFNFASS